MSSPATSTRSIPIRLGHSALFHDHYIYFFGGLQKSSTNSQRPLEFVNDFIQLDTRSHQFTNLTPTLTTPSPCARNFHTTVLNASTNEMILFGGKSNGFHNDVWSFNFSNQSWKKLDCKDSQLITPRYGHASVIYGDSMFVFGGYDNNAFTSRELFELNLKTLEWKSVALKLSSANDHDQNETVSGRFYHATVLDEENGDWYLIGGKSSNGLTKDFIKIKLSTLITLSDNSQNDHKEEFSKAVEFEFIESGDEHVWRYGHSCILEKIENQKKIYMMGGCNQSVDFFDCYCLGLTGQGVTSKWKKVNRNENVLAQLFQTEPYNKPNETTPFEAFPVFHTITRYVNQDPQTVSYFVFGGSLQKTEIETCVPSKQKTGQNVKLKNQQEDEFNYKEFDSMLNDDIYRNILSFLECVDLMRLQLVSKSLRICQLTEEDQFWKNYYMQKIDELIQATADYYYDSSVRQTCWRYDSKYDHLPQRKENFKQGLIEIFKTFLTNAEKNSKLLTAEIERQSCPQQPKRKFFTRDDILAYPKQAMNLDAKEGFKMVTIGDGATGKTSLLITYTTNAFPFEYVPTVFDNYNYVSRYMPNYTIWLWDTAGPEDYDRLRPLSYPQTDLFLLCFSVISKASLLNVATKWVPEVRHHCPDCPILLIATKTDLRKDPVHTKSMLMKHNEKPITKEQGELMARKMGCVSYIETSAIKGEGFDRFDELVLKAICVDKDDHYKVSSDSKRSV
ncbi:hypothetical protein FDP41_007326 [Naegleria fowleri]|uniref:F-box domain-containing protein n=1 Tax=Naegleria fowleri TaxID=5763 RepID=A0A6A5CFS0_NAEFO|nr:uncharacterized protein FDP41_007326 [Naegleria fowleri]KAF0984149.1 hypothetical protein FDP41_007326 [Naegleria fowleri]